MTFKIFNKDLFLNPPKAIIFDTDNTLYPYIPAHKAAIKSVVKKGSQILGISYQSFNKAYSSARQEVKQRLGNVASSHSRLLYAQRAVEILGMKSQILLSLDLEQTYWRTFLTSCELFPFIRELLAYIKSKNIKTAIVTDLTAQIQFRKIIYFGLEDFFDYIVTSEESGKDKPDKSSFELILNKLNLEANACWMIGDSFDADIVGSMKLGITAIQKINSPLDNLNKLYLGDATFQEFESIYSFLKELDIKS